MNVTSSVAEQPISRSHRTLVGMIAVASSTLVIKLSSLISQWILGTVLAKDDFELWAMAFTANAFIAGLRDGGTGRILLQRGCNPDEIRKYAHFSWLLNILAFVVLVLLSPFAARFYGRSDVVPLILLIAVSVLLMTPTTIGNARLANAMRFRELALISGTISVASYILMVTLALLGFGAISLAIPQVASSVLGLIIYPRVAGRIPNGESLTWESARKIFSSAKWLILAAFAISFGTNGDYIVVGRFAKEYLADYFFGFQLTFAVSMLFAGSIQQVLLPMFVTLKNEPAKQGKAFHRAVSLTLFAAAPICCAMLVLSPPLMKILWADKWDGAVIVAQIMSINLMFRLITPLSVALFQSQAKWPLYFLSLSIEALIVFVASYVGTQIGGLVAIALTVGICRSISPPTVACLAARGVGLPARAILLAVARYVGLFTTAALLTMWSVPHVQSLLLDTPTTPSPWADFVFRASVLFIFYAILFTLFLRRETAEVWQILRQKKSGKLVTERGSAT